LPPRKKLPFPFPKGAKIAAKPRGSGTTSSKLPRFEQGDMGKLHDALSRASVEDQYDIHYFNVPNGVIPADYATQEPFLGELDSSN
jgi:hypothetical protein